MVKKLLDLKKKMKKKLPSFTRKDSHKKKKISRGGWRSPKGLHNKMRLQRRGHKRIVKTGYRTPISIRGLNSQGLRIMCVSNLDEIRNINAEKECVEISSTVSKKKLIEMLGIAKTKKIVVLSYKDVSEKIEELEKSFESRKLEKKKKLTSRTKKKEEKAKKVEEESKKEEKEKEVDGGDEEKKVEEKKEKDKLLTKKQ
ncbi:hypothetical protein GOV05_02115 [Candidatus Woesearchaeota archaeon]|nr:hypothetical protein [Candidatus Woesearchaeota archaeon]